MINKTHINHLKEESVLLLNKITDFMGLTMESFIRVFSLTIIFSIALSPSINAQTLERHQAITAYIYNFANNIQWQNEEAINEFQFLLIGEGKDVYNEMELLSNTKTLRGKPIKIVSKLSVDNIDGVQLIYITKDQENSLTELFDKIEGKNILLISDNFQDKRLIMINFTESENETLRFEINKANIINQNLLFTDDLVLLGGTEIDVATLYREGQQSLRSLQKYTDNLQKHTDNLENDLLGLEQTITSNTQEMQIQKDSLDKQMLKMLAQNDSLNKQTLKIQEQQKTLSTQSQLLEEKKTDIRTQTRKIQEQQNILDNQYRESEKQKEDLNKGNELLQDQKDKILSQTKILEEQTGTIDKQKNILYLLVIITILVIILVFLIYYGYKNKQKLNKVLESKVKERTNELGNANEQLLSELSSRKLAEVALKETNTYLECLYNNVDFGVFVIDVENNSTYRHVGISPVHEKLIKLKSEEIIGKTTDDLIYHFGKETIAEVNQLYKNIVDTGKVVEYENFAEINGEGDWWLSRITPLRNEKNKIYRLIGTMIKISDRKQNEEALRESEAKLNALFTSLTETVVMHELVLNAAGKAIDYRIIDCNKVFTEVTGIRKEDAIGKLASEVYQTDPPPYLEQYAKVALGGDSHEFTTFYPQLDKHLMISVVSPQHGIFATITTDITPMMQIQETIMAKNKEMENYLYVTSHDLRTPLVNIQGFSQRLKKQADSIKTLFADKTLEPELLHQLGIITDEDIPKTLSFVFSNIEKMDTLINGLLHLSRTGRVDMNIQKIDMNELFVKILQSLDFQIKEAQCKIHINPLPACYGDATLLDQLFANIISNALKYSDSERALEITVDAKKTYNKLVYTIRDNGKGIAQKHLEKIWDVFYRIDPRLGKTGEGIGLSLVKRIAEKHKGKVWAESEENKGSVFHIELQNRIFTEF